MPYFNKLYVVSMTGLVLLIFAIATVQAATTTVLSMHRYTDPN